MVASITYRGSLCLGKHWDLGTSQLVAQVKGEGVMKCDENGGCPFYKASHYLEDTWGYCKYSWGIEPCVLKNQEPFPDCHLTPDLFPIIRAMIAGEWTCEKCGNTDAPCCDTDPLRIPCAAWQPRED
jgi:hypothetical protein